ncbi:MAG: SPOR domain-containing protein [Magnetococcales bacterium]|nr:SPOR domain-containing protein [Magnetococcales bacterium]
MLLSDMLARTLLLKSGAKKLGRVFKTKQSIVLVAIMLVVVIFSASNLPSAQYDTQMILSEQHQDDLAAIQEIFPFVPIQKEKIFNSTDFIRTKVSEVAVVEEQQPKVEERKVVAKLEVKEAPAIPEKIDLLEETSALIEPEQQVEELDVVRTIKVDNKQLPVFQKDLSALQSWRYAVQVAAIYGEDLADDLVDYLSNKGYSPVIWESEDNKGRRFHRIWIGLYQDSERATKAREYYKTHENKHAFVTPVAWDSVEQSNNL